MPRRIAWLSEKGGVGKTTSAINTAVGLAKLGHRTLVVDSDPQGNSSLVLLGGQAGRGADAPPGPGGRSGRGVEAIRPTSVPGLDIIPADASLADANLSLAGELGRERRLRVAMEGVEDDYEFVMIDTSPARSLLTVNVMCYVREILVPVNPGLFSLSGLGQLQTAVAEVRRFLDNRLLRIAGIVLTRTARSNVATGGRGADPRAVRRPGPPDDHPERDGDRGSSQPVSIGPGLFATLDRREGIRQRWSRRSSPMASERKTGLGTIAGGTAPADHAA